MKIVIYLIVIALVIGGAVALLGGKKTAETPPVSPSELAGESAPEAVTPPGGAALPEQEAAAFPAKSLYNYKGFLDCGYFWNDVREACPAVKQTKWNSPDPWDINAFPETCMMKALGSAEGEFTVNVSRATGKGAESAEALFNSGRASFAEIGYKTVEVTGLGEKAYTVPDPFSDVQTGYNFTVKKGSWLMDIISGIPEFCATELQTKDVVQRILKKLP